MLGVSRCTQIWPTWPKGTVWPEASNKRKSKPGKGLPIQPLCATPKDRADPTLRLHSVCPYNSLTSAPSANFAHEIRSAESGSPPDDMLTNRVSSGTSAWRIIFSAVGGRKARGTSASRIKEKAVSAVNLSNLLATKGTR